MKRICSVILIFVMLSMLFICPLQANAAMSADAISWYKAKLNYLHDHYIDGVMDAVSEAYSKFALIDIDGDGTDEMITNLFDYPYPESVNGKVFCYDKAKSTISECAVDYVSAVYQNGYLKVDPAQSYDPGHISFPYSVYRYSASTKTAKLIFTAEKAAWGDEYGNRYYAYSDDADHDGVVYYINDEPMTEVQYNAYVDRYIPAKNKRNVVWYKMSKTNISKLSNQMISQEYQLAKPRITRIDNVNSGAKITWTKVTGAQRYAVFMVYDGLHWKRIATTTANSYLHKVNDSGGLYFYTVRCMSADGTAFTSGYYAGYGNIFVSPPKAPTLTRTSSGIRIKWKKPEGAVKFRVFRKTGSGKWQKLGDTTSTQWTNKSVKIGKKYTYTIRCISADGKQYQSGYHTKGTSMVY